MIRIADLPGPQADLENARTPGRRCMGLRALAGGFEAMRGLLTPLPCHLASGHRPEYLSQPFGSGKVLVE